MIFIHLNRFAAIKSFTNQISGNLNITNRLSCKILLDNGVCPTQVIYKKTQVPCPLPYYQNAYNHSLNGSEAMGLYQIPANLSHMADVSPALAGSATTAAAVHLEPHANAEDMCTPKYFVFNSQVRCWCLSAHVGFGGQILHG